MINNGLFTSNTPEWETPQNFFDELNEEFNFNQDVCATKENAKCESYFSKDDDGLKMDWKLKVCWMNPPYGKEISSWVKKAYDETHKELINERAWKVVCLLPSRTDTRWFHNYIYGKAEIRFIKGRLKFGNSKNSAPFPSMIVIFK